MVAFGVAKIVIVREELNSGRNMTVTRRGILAGLMAGAASPLWGEAVTRSLRPMARPDAETFVADVMPPQGSAAGLVGAAKLGGTTGYIVAEVASGRVLEQENADALVPPASVVKAITALYGLDRLGTAHRFTTQIMVVGQISGDRLDGDLVLVGGGDPTLDSDKLGDLVAQLARTGLRRVTGRFLAYAGALPGFERITGDQPVQVGYNPGLSGLGLNYNRVNFEWTKGGTTIAMTARGERYVPPVKMARMRVVERAAPVFGYAMGPGVEEWSVARAALRSEGSRWLPVRQVADYVAEVFQTLCAAQGIALGRAEVVQVMPVGARPLVAWHSDELATVLRQMLRFSTNITAETVGMAASGAAGHAASAAAMAAWAAQRLGLRANLVDHSGLGAASRVTAAWMMQALANGDRVLGIRPILRNIGMRDDAGKQIKGSPVKVIGKSGTLNFVSGLAGFIEPPSGRDLVFAIFSADAARREAVPLGDREDPPGEGAWVRRAHLLQARLISRWAGMV